MIRLDKADPFPASVTLSDKLRAVRRRLGFTHKAFAEQLEVDPVTLRNGSRARLNQIDFREKL
jgi:DNA-binding transcriptional regulator YiaG